MDQCKDAYKRLPGYEDGSRAQHAADTGGLETPQPAFVLPRTGEKIIGCDLYSGRAAQFGHQNVIKHVHIVPQSCSSIGARLGHSGAPIGLPNAAQSGHTHLRTLPFRQLQVESMSTLHLGKVCM